MRVKKPQSDFGRGLTYCLGLFLAHSERKISTHNGENDYHLWFNGASDHLYELEIPETFPPSLKARLKEFQHKCLSWGHGFGFDGIAPPTEKDWIWSIEEAETLLRLIDVQIGVAVSKARHG